MVTELSKQENNYQSAFRALQQANPSTSWVELLRESAMDRFESLGFPSVSDEEWKYTNLAQLKKRNFQPVSTAGTSEIDKDALRRFSYPETATTQLFVVNGFLRSDLSSIKGLGGIVALELSTAIGDAKY